MAGWRHVGAINWGSRWGIILFLMAVESGTQKISWKHTNFSQTEDCLDCCHLICGEKLFFLTESEHPKRRILKTMSFYENFNSDPSFSFVCFCS